MRFHLGSSFIFSFPFVHRMTAVDKKRVVYNVIEYSPLCDSSNMMMEDWIHIANDIKVYLEHI